MTWRLKKESDAGDILDHFNGFHDGFIKALSLRSHDYFEQQGAAVTDIAHALTGHFDVVIDIAHYNYAQGTQPYDRIIRCHFKDVKAFCFDLRDVSSHEWPIKVVEIKLGQRKNDHDQVERCFTLVFSWSKLVDNQWSTRTAQVLTFREAEFDEH
ncbi:MAG: hypothetical protein ACE5H7_13010 [Acidiferrobacterales bacterium]